MVSKGYVEKRTFQQHPLWQVEAPALSHLDIELTERCNNACLHCYINLPERDRNAQERELSTDEWKDILRQAVELGALSVRFTGGEPLLREDFVELYLYARRLGLKVVLFTNARLITPELADLFARIPPLKKIEITVYGMHPQSYEAVACAPGAFIEFQRGVELLLERQIPFVVKSVLLPPNQAEVGEFETWAESIPAMEYDPSYSIILDLRARRDSAARNRLINELRFTPKEVLSLLSRNEIEYRKSMAQYCAAGFVRPQGDKLYSCGAGESGCVDAYGNYQMCMLLRHPDTVYNLKNGTLREALAEVFPRTLEMRASNPEYLQRCARCFLRGICEQCPARSWMEHGTLDTPVEYLCQVAHAQAHYLGLLAEGEVAWEVEDWQQRITKLAETTQVDSGDRQKIPHQPSC